MSYSSSFASQAKKNKAVNENNEDTQDFFDDDQFNFDDDDQFNFDDDDQPENPSDSVSDDDLPDSYPEDDTPPEPSAEDNAHDRTKLQNRVIQRSVAKDWAHAKLEWELEYIYEEPDGQCICDKHPITDHCVIRNRANKNSLVVGNVCVQRFEGEISEMSKLTCANLKKLRKDPTSSRANEQMMKLAHRRGIIDDKGYKMYKESWRKRSLSKRQANWIASMNNAILVGFSKPPKCCSTCNSVIYVKLSKKNNRYFWCNACKKFL